MTKYCGKDLLIVNSADAVVGGLRSTGVTINNEAVDVTTKGDMPWRQQAACGVKSMSISGSGVFSNDTILIALQAVAMSTTPLANYKIISGYGDEFDGDWIVTSFERTGEYNGAEEFSVSLENASDIVYTAPV